MQQIAPSWFTFVRAILEIAYLLSGVVLAGVGIAALYQLKLAKENLLIATDALKTAKADIQLRVRREAATLAADKCEHFGDHTLPQIQNNLNTLAGAGIKLSTWPLENKLFNESSIKEWEAPNLWISQIIASEKTRNATLSILNFLEGFAVYFAKGAADEEVAYPSIGFAFCNLVETFAPYLIRLREHKIPNTPSGPYLNIVELYSSWSARAKREQLETEAIEIKSKLSSISENKIKPIGIDGQS